MRTRLTNSETGHAWYYNSKTHTPDVGANNFFFSGDTIYSYGSHYPIARKINDLVLFTLDGSGYTGTSGYGPTTSRHVSLTAQAIPYDKTVIFVNDPAAKGKQAHKWNYDHNIKLIKTILKEIAKGRNGSWIQSKRIKDVEKIVEGLNIYTKTFKLGKRQIDVNKFFDTDYLAKVKEKERKLAKAKAEKERKRQAELQAYHESVIDAWKKGEKVRIPREVRKCYLRVVDDIVETSQGAAIKLRRGIKLFDYVKSVIAGTTNFQRASFGNFELSRVGKKDITIGCHVIDIDEMERVYNTI